MEMALESSVLGRPALVFGVKSSSFWRHDIPVKFPAKVSLRNNRSLFWVAANCIGPCNFGGFMDCGLEKKCVVFDVRAQAVVKNGGEMGTESGAASGSNVELISVLLKSGIVLGAMVCGVLVFGCSRAFSMESLANAGCGVIDQSKLLLRNSWPKLSELFRVFREQGLILAALLGLSAFFSMAETSITTLWPWKIRELTEKESENGVFKMLRRDVTRFLTTILIGTTVVNIGATALVTEAATTLFGEAGVSAATGVMTVAILLLTEITPKSVAVHNATEVARVVVRPVAWLSLILYPVGRVVSYLSMGILKMLGLKGRSEPYVTEDELKLMLRGAELSGAIEEE